MYKILIAEDDLEITKLLKLYLENEGTEVFSATDGQKAEKMLNESKYDLLIADIMMPFMNGFELIKKIRKTTDIPVIIISAKITSQDKIFGFGIGADDYITKPFDPMEVAARVKAHIRRYRNNLIPENTVKITEHKDLLYKWNEKSLLLNGEEVILTGLEIHLMELFLKNIGRVFTSSEIYKAAWAEDDVLIFEEYLDRDKSENAVRVALSKLRSKIGEGYITTIRGLGYRFE